MKKLIILSLLFFSLMKSANAQDFSGLKIDSLKHLLSKAKNDTNKVIILAILSSDYVYSYPDSAILYAKPGLQLAQKLNFVNGQINLLQTLEAAYSTKGNYPQSLHLNFEELNLVEKLGNPLLVARALLDIGDSYSYAGNQRMAISYYKRAESNRAFSKDGETVPVFIGQAYLKLNKVDSALIYTNKAYASDIKRKEDHWAVPYITLGEIYEKMGDNTSAMAFYQQSIKLSQVNNDKVRVYLDLANIYKNIGKPDSSIYYAHKSLNISLRSSLPFSVVDAAKLLSTLYRFQHNSDSTLKYQDVMLAAKDSAFSIEKIRQMENFAFDEKTRQQAIIDKHEQYRNKVRMFSLIAGVLVFLVLVIILWRNNRHKQKANKVLEATLDNLKATQTQLIQSEKMASLGELTAGIAHEIQNPLNFVNNFSEVSIELLNEMEAELKRGETEDAIDIASDVKQNLEKINHHGKRADAIVKGMLQHSQSGSGTKEPTDINSLAGECMRLSYHGLRAKDKSFTAELGSHLDETLPKLNVIPQDMVRVMLNLFNNAFYAVNQKQKTEGSDYKPEVSITTSFENGQVVIKVKDNGVGIPDAIKDKIMQPFFTTKPTGEGTGLGLSLSYDIVVKGHGGSIQVNSKEGEGSEFIIQLPSH